LGGTCWGRWLAILGGQGEEWVEASPFSPRCTDFFRRGEIGCSSTSRAVAAREAAIGSGGVCQARTGRGVLGAAGERLIWSYVVNNYLKGRSPAAFACCTGTPFDQPARSHYCCTSHMSWTTADGAGELTMLGTPVDLSKVRPPDHVLAAREDTSCPGRALSDTQLMRGRCARARESGHIAGVVNPARRTGAATGSTNRCPTADPEAWLARERAAAGSWWTDWNAWLAQYSGGEVKAKKAFWEPPGTR